MPKCPKCEDENPQLGAKCPRDGFYYVYDDAYDLAQSDPRIGTMSVDKYVIIGRISKGGMGAVYRAMQLPVEREVAFKVLRTEMEGSDKSRDRFIREARAVSKLTHPNIITLYDFGFDENQHPYMAMEYAPGMDLSKWLKQDDLTIERVLHVLRQLLGALDAAHLQGIVHRDLKPENMIVTETSRDRDFVKLLDFGIARMINETSTRGLTREGEVFGTPHYMAPEQAQGAKEVGPPADVYAVGIMLYELLTGDTPYDAPTPLAVLLMHINEPLPEVVAKPGIVITPQIVSFLQRAVAKNPEERFADAGEMLGALDALITQMGLHSTGAFMGVARSERTGEHVRPSNSSGVSNEHTNAPTLSPEQNRIYTDSYSDVAIHDPDPSALINQADLAQAFQANADPAETSTELYAAQPQSNKKVMVALATVIVLLLVAGGAIAVIVGNKDDTKESDSSVTQRAPANEIAQKDAPKVKDTPEEPKEDPVAEVPVDEPVAEVPVQEEPVKEEPDVETPEDTKPVVEKKKAPIRKTPPPKDPVVVKKDPPQDKQPAAQKKPPKKDPEPQKDVWGAPTKEQKEKFKKNDKW